MPALKQQTKPKWWNWQTRYLEGVVAKVVGVRVPPSAPIENKKVSHLFGWPFLFADDGDGTRTVFERRASALKRRSGRSAVSENTRVRANGREAGAETLSPPFGTIK
mgnify:FL=1